MYQESVGEHWNMNFTDMPNEVAQPADFQVFLSDLSVDSLMGSWLETGDIQGWIEGDKIPMKNDTIITAKMLKVAFPGLAEKYGDDAIVDIHGNCTSLHDFTSAAETKSVTVYGTVNLQFWPRFNGTTENAVDINLVDVKFGGQIAIENFNATANVTSLKVDKIEVVSSTIGNIPVRRLKLEINTAAAVAVGILTTWLEKYALPIPQDIFGIFKLSDIFLAYADGFLFAGATPTFEGIPALTETQAVAMQLVQ